MDGSSKDHTNIISVSSSLPQPSSYSNTLSSSWTVPLALPLSIFFLVSPSHLQEPQPLSESLPIELVRVSAFPALLPNQNGYGYHFLPPIQEAFAVRAVL
ncbi:unnamed protein product [Nezara viridula]|uniref:Uncharacterized protein n=1 Tax=Nezara viridula TaxID=85310 RepID=A0A9P0HNV2_NEZVI|nr:unnamed protein product [Nezara viridula]